jgi:hypothetical protein
VGGSGFDLLHLDPRAIDLFDDVLDGGALQMNGLGFLFWRVLEHKGLGTTSRRFSFLSSFASCSCRDTKWKGFCHRSGTTNKGGNLLTKRGFQRSFRYPSVELRDRVRAAVKKRGFRSEQAFLIAACENELERGDSTEATYQLEAQIAATLANMAKEVQSLFTLVHKQVALTNSLVQYVLTCAIEPPADVLPAARAWARLRYARILRLAGER